jgi:antitoxin component of RelBE/YafQ-DinJ toxin-antitoxin module
VVNKEKTTLTIDPAIKRRAEEYVKRMGVSLSALVTMLLVREMNMGKVLTETRVKSAGGRILVKTSPKRT